MLKKILCMLLAIIMLLSLCACGDKEPGETVPTIPEESVEVQDVETEPTENFEETVETVKTDVEEPIVYNAWYSSLAENTQEAISNFKINNVEYDISLVTLDDIDKNEIVAERNIVAENVGVNESHNVPKAHSKYEHITISQEGSSCKIYSRADAATGRVYAIADVFIEGYPASVLFYNDLSVGINFSSVVEKVGAVELTDYYIDNTTVKDSVVLRNAQNTMVILFKEFEIVKLVNRLDEDGNQVLGDDGEPILDEEVVTDMIVNEIVLINNSAYDPEIVYEVVEKPEEVVEEVVDETVESKHAESSTDVEEDGAETEEPISEENNEEDVE